MATDVSSTRIVVPHGCQSSVMFLDESGSKGSGGGFFVMAAVKTDDPDLLTRGLEAIRQKRGFRTEFEFGNLTRDALPAYRTWSS